jgi:hypothetical protein
MQCDALGRVFRDEDTKMVRQTLVVTPSMDPLQIHVFVAIHLSDHLLATLVPSDPSL